MFVDGEQDCGGRSSCQYRRPRYTYGVVRGVLALALAAATVASASTRPVVTERDSGKTFTIRAGRVLSLRLSDGYRWTPPKVTGRAIRLTPVNYLRNPGFREWEVHARERGTARVTATGYAEAANRRCDPGPCSPRLFRVTFVVRA
jgi:hypothetical protein